MNGNVKSRKIGFLEKLPEIRDAFVALSQEDQRYVAGIIQGMYLSKQAVSESKPKGVQLPA